MAAGHPRQFEAPRKQWTDKEFLYMSTIEDAMHTIAFMTEYCRQHHDTNLHELTIADAFACLGGNTHSFCRTFKDVVAYEINDTRRQNLTNNMRRYGRKCRVFGDCEAEENGIFTTPRDIIFLDPPWENEKKEVDDTAFKHVISLCHKISQRTTTKYVFMKLPLQHNERKGVDNRSNFEQLQAAMSPDWDEISIYTVDRMKKDKAQPTYSIVCACRKQKPMEGAAAMPSKDTPSVNLLLMQLSHLHA